MIFGHNYNRYSQTGQYTGVCVVPQLLESRVQNTLDPVVV